MGAEYGLIQPADSAGNRGKNSGFRQMGRRRGRFCRKNYCQFKRLTENPAAGGTAENFVGTADFARGEQKSVRPRGSWYSVKRCGRRLECPPAG